MTDSSDSLRVVVTVIVGDEELDTIRTLERLRMAIEDACERNHAHVSFVVQRTSPSAYEILDENPPRLRRKT